MLRRNLLLNLHGRGKCTSVSPSVVVFCVLYILMNVFTNNMEFLVNGPCTNDEHLDDVICK